VAWVILLAISHLQLVVHSNRFLRWGRWGGGISVIKPNFFSLAY
jgi:hypothetical protein